MFFIPNIRKGVTVVGILAALIFPWVLTNGPGVLFGTGKNLVAVPDTMLVCAKHEDCGYVETACSSCCRYKAISKAFEQLYYQEHYYPVCAEYEGAVCDCAPGYVKPICVKGKCRLDTPPPDYND